MEIVVKGNVDAGVELGTLPFGSVAKLAKGSDAFYLIASPMDGTGRRVAVTLVAGTVKEFGQDERMIPVVAVVYVERAR